MRSDGGVEVARAVVTDRFPAAVAAWVAGSVVSGTATPSSDLDVTVLIQGPPAPYRESIRYDEWPVELFVHTAASVSDFLDRDRSRRRPTMARLIASGVRLLGAAEARVLEELCADHLVAGPDPLTDAERAARRYALSDLLDDLGDVRDPQLRTAVAVDVWRASAELLLAEQGSWWGSGKWLVRELWALDRKLRSRHCPRLHGGLVAAIHGEPTLLVEVASEILDASGGRLWEGYRAGG